MVSKLSKFEQNVFDFYLKDSIPCCQTKSVSPHITDYKYMFFIDKIIWGEKLDCITMSANPLHTHTASQN